MSKGFNGRLNKQDMAQFGWLAMKFFAYQSEGFAEIGEELQ